MGISKVIPIKGFLLVEVIHFPTSERYGSNKVFKMMNSLLIVTFLSLKIFST